MGELAASATPDEELTSIGLGSCVGVAVLDRMNAVAALAHVMLPSAGPNPSGPPGKYADRAVPALIDAAERLGARRRQLEAVLVGGAQMFDVSVGSGLDIGPRNATAVRAALAAERIPVRAEALGGRRGRTMRVHVGELAVTVKEAGGRERALWRARPLAHTSGAEVRQR